jgi:hypothetical protein
LAPHPSRRTAPSLRLFLSSLNFVQGFAWALVIEHGVSFSFSCTEVGLGLFCARSGGLHLKMKSIPQKIY